MTGTSGWPLFYHIVPEATMEERIRLRVVRGPPLARRAPHHEERGEHIEGSLRGVALHPFCVDDALAFSPCNLTNLLMASLDPRTGPSGKQLYPCWRP